MIRLNPPDEAGEEEIEAFMASLRGDAREGVRELLLAGAGEAEVAEYIGSLDQAPEEDPEEEFEPSAEEPPLGGRADKRWPDVTHSRSRGGLSDGKGSDLRCGRP
jgi:hypothetical protein